MTMRRPSRRRTVRGGLIGLGLAGLAAVTSGCGSNVSTPPDMVAVHYTGGPTSGTNFKDCVPAGTYRSDGFGDTHYMYPTNQRTYDASTNPGAESGPITVVSKDNQEMSVAAAVTFQLKTGDCNILHAFHERLGLRYNAFWTGDPDVDKPEGNKGWLQLLQFVFGKSLDTTLDREAQNYTWQQLWNDPTTRTAVETAADTKLTALIKSLAGGDYFDVLTVRIQKPDPANAQLKANISAAQAEVAKANTAEAQARAQKAAADAQVAVAKAQAASVAEQIKVLGAAGYLETLRIKNQEDAIAKGINPYPSPIVAGVNAR
jgi:FKBP-type peptidyl-prolyl cis-trans isomerase